MNCEVSILLVHRCDQLKHMSDDSLKQLPQVFEKVLQYVKRFSHFTNQDAVKQVRDSGTSFLPGPELQFDHAVSMQMPLLAVLGNLCPETVEEANVLVPSLKTKGRSHDDEAIEKLLNDLLMVKKFE
ncbi:hypothetical protein FEM48_Zijuj05G0166000 [Ziziphus jujuba var. spinosa]|uniref:RNA polymerase Rpb4/RPC9 core domain-containing protein n=1 Tax=Ziziphus jujuba var. spinosa TaxID=714518 RepID=A0A978VFX5_ZIZJJ|nr:hypothetical protein FEM48_Zijuj05G0166000 [Ziziphus jujuba var. spinosa]